MDFASFIFSNAFVIMFLPVWSALLITMNSTVPSFRSKHFTINLTLISTGICALYSISLLYITASTKMLFNNDVINWLQVGNSSLGFGFLLDNMSALFLSVFTVISFLFQLYSYKHIKEDEGFQRYFVYLNIFNFSMTGLLVSTNLFQTYMFFVLTGVFSYLLYGFLTNKKTADTSSKNIFLLNIAGDCFILLGVILLLYLKLNFFPEGEGILLNYSFLYDLCQGVISYATDLGFYIICLSIILGLGLKSFMFTFFTNPKNTIEAPAASLAIIESTAFLIPSVYIMSRLLPVFNLSEYTVKTVFWFGISVALICSITGLFQNNFRKILSYGLCSQIGLIYAGLSIFSTSSGLFHMTNLAFASALLILVSGIITDIYDNTDNIRFIGGLRKTHPVLFVLWLAGALSFTGIFFSGAFSEVALSGSFLSKGMIFEYTLFIIIGAFITFAFAKACFYIFEGEYTGLIKLKEIKIYPQTKIAICILFIFTVFFGILSFNLYGDLFDINLKTKIKLKEIVPFFAMNFLSIIFALVLFKNKIIIGEKLPKIKFSLTPLYRFKCKCLYYAEKIINEVITNIIRFSVKLLSFIISGMKTSEIQTQILFSVLVIILALVFALFYYYKLRGV